jgi:FkbM family methyltransferase
LNLVEPAQTAQMSKALRTGNVFFDIGANVGYYSLLGSRLVGSSGHVYAWEPLPRNISYLYRHLTINKVTNVTIVPFACFSVFDVVNFQPSPVAAMGRVLPQRSQKHGGGRPGMLLVAGVTVDQLCEHLKIQPDVLKIDVEGSEMHVLRGASKLLKYKNPAIFLSTHSKKLKQSCLQVLKAYGYKIIPLNDSAAGTDFFCENKIKKRPSAHV